MKREHYEQIARERSVKRAKPTKPSLPEPTLRNAHRDSITWLREPRELCRVNRTLVVGVCRHADKSVRDFWLS